ncbi:MAG TPA: rhodanese-like domain-containing protein, partial [Oleiagrimonas sp.]|nr:rhodanese-like domain-containing protein [Oleiagrimonas sp.]
PVRAKIAPLPQARILEEEGYEAIDTLPKDTVLAFICVKGISSKGVAEQFAAHGFENVYSVDGGMNEWQEAFGG